LHDGGAGAGQHGFAQQREIRQALAAQHANLEPKRLPELL
jgi:hypothetical protein